MLLSWSISSSINYRIFRLSQCFLSVMNGPLKFLTARKILALLDLLACSCSPNFCVARKLAKQIFYFCSCSQKNRSARHARECSQRPFVTPFLASLVCRLEIIQPFSLNFIVNLSSSYSSIIAFSSNLRLRLGLSRLCS